MKGLAWLAVASLVACVGAAAQGPDPAANFPNRPVRLVVPFPPGGSNDILGRFVAQHLSERLGQQVVVENRAGADGLIGTDMVARAEPDGYTLVFVSTSYTMNAAIHKMPFDPLKSLVPVARVASGGNLIAVNPKLAANNIGELIAMAKAEPGRLRYASSGLGGFNHFGGALFNSLAGVRIEHVPYKGGGPALLDVMSGHVEIVFGTLTQALPHVRSGRLKALAVGSPKRSQLLPNLPTIAESGVPGYDGSIWWGVLARAGTAPSIVAKLNAGINSVMRDPDAVKRLESEAALPVTDTPESFARLIESELVKWNRIVSEAGIRAH